MLQRKIGKQLFKTVHGVLAVQTEYFFNLRFRNFLSRLCSEAKSSSHDNNLFSLRIQSAYDIIVDHLVYSHKSCSPSGKRYCGNKKTNFEDKDPVLNEHLYPSPSKLVLPAYQ